MHTGKRADFGEMRKAILDAMFRQAGACGFTTLKEARFGIDQGIYAPNVMAGHLKGGFDQSDLLELIKQFSTDNKAVISKGPGANGKYEQWLIVTPKTLQELKSGLHKAKVPYTEMPKQKPIQHL